MNLTSNKEWLLVTDVDDTLAKLPVALEVDGIIGAMGAEVRCNGELDAPWSTRSGDWDRAVVDAGLGGAMGCRPHDEQLQTRYKASYAVPSAEQDQALEKLEATGLPTMMVRSGTDDFDVMPPNAGQGEATLYVAERLGVAPEGLIVVGGSGNDVAMFRIAAKGIVKGNARDELRERVDRDRVYFASAHAADGLLEGLEHYGALNQLSRKEAS